MRWLSFVWTMLTVGIRAVAPVDAAAANPDSLMWSRFGLVSVTGWQSTTLVVAVVDSSANGLTGIRYPNLLVDGRRYVASMEGLARVDSVGSGVHTVRVMALGWEFQPPDTVIIERGSEPRLLVHVMRGKRPITKE